MTSPENRCASATPSAVLPVAVGPTTATTAGFALHDASKLLFQLLSGKFEHAGTAMGAERRHLAGEDLLGQCHKLLRGGLVPALMAARQEMECSTHSVCSFSASRLPFEQAVGDLHQQSSAFCGSTSAGTARSSTVLPPKSATSSPAFSSRGLVFQQRLLFLCGKVDGGGLQQQLAGHVAVVGSKFSYSWRSWAACLSIRHSSSPPLRQNIGAENLAHIPQRLFPLRYIKAQLFRLLGLHRLLRLIGHRCSFDLRGGRHGVPCRHVIQQRVGCGGPFPGAHPAVFQQQQPGRGCGAVWTFVASAFSGLWRVTTGSRMSSAGADCRHEGTAAAARAGCAGCTGGVSAVKAGVFTGAAAGRGGCGACQRCAGSVPGSA